MTNIYLKVTIEKNRHSQNFDFSSLKIRLEVSFLRAPTQYVHLQGWSLNFRHVRAKCNDKVPDVSDSNENIETSCKPKLKLSELKD